MSTLSLRLRVGAMRAEQALGRAGLLGVALLLAASVWAGLAWQARHAPLPQPEAPAQPEPAPPPHAPAVPALTALDLPHRSEVPLLLTQIQRTVLANGMDWPAAEYKLSAASDAAPAALEVRCSLKGTYPRLRAALARLLRDVPALSVRELSVTRANADTPEVEARLTLAVFLREDGAGDAGSASASASASASGKAPP